MRQKLVVLFATLLIFLNVLLAFAVLPKEGGGSEDILKIQPSQEELSAETTVIEKDEQSVIPTLSVNLIEDGEKSGIYGTLNYIPEDAENIIVWYSFNGKDFHGVENSDGEVREWELNTSQKGEELKLTQLCIDASDHPFEAYKSEKVNSLYIKLEISRYTEDSWDVDTNAAKLTHGKTWDVPNSQPSFLAAIESTNMGYYILKGTFTDFQPDTAHIIPMYSLNGESYAPIKDIDPWNLRYMGTVNSDKLKELQTQICAKATFEPLKSYREGTVDQFYVKLQIITEDGKTYDSQAAMIERGSPKPPPADTYMKANFLKSMMFTKGKWPDSNLCGKYQITVREGATSEEIATLLPDTLPMKVEVIPEGSYLFIADGIASCNVEWKQLPSFDLEASGSITISDAANSLVILSGTAVSTPLGIFLLPEDVPVSGASPYESDEIELEINVVGKDEKPDISLMGDVYDEDAVDYSPLSLAFSLKPSGATSIKAYSFMEGDEKWIEICDLLSRRDVNANQNAKLYGGVEVLQHNEAPYANYLEGKIKGFLIGVIIEGGVFDGEKVILPWHGEYNPPTLIPDLVGSGGNENNSGSGDGGNAGNSGERPDLPQGGMPSQPSDESTNSPVETTLPELPKPGLTQESIPAGNVSQIEQGSRIQGNSAAVTRDNTVSAKITSDKFSDVPQRNFTKNHDLNKAESSKNPLNAPAAKTIEREPSESEWIPIGVTATVVTGGIVVAVATASGTASAAAATGVASKVIAVLRKLFF